MAGHREGQPIPLPHRAGGPPAEDQVRVGQTQAVPADPRPRPEPPVPRCALRVAAVISNPFARRADDDLDELIQAGEDLGALLVARAVDALGVKPADVAGYGKGAVVGTGGAIEHAVAVLHPRFGRSVRALVSPGKAIMSSSAKAGAPGSPLLIPLANKEEIWAADDFDAAEITIPDAAHPDEIVIGLALSVGGRPGHRITLSPPASSN
ncbi:amino acid synthesis family protein [Amycolatopsis sp. NPDC051373]|uniref:amino acid synthesis family protein n=1 Tax=Amycolatopsis sp. NPDC051373 TaxID=3155801 RepID=UPI00344E2480